MGLTYRSETITHVPDITLSIHHGSQEEEVDRPDQADEPVGRVGRHCGRQEGRTAGQIEIVKRLWAYLKEHQLQDPENKQFFTPDKTMEPVFGSEKIRAFSMSKYLKDHISA